MSDHRAGAVQPGLHGLLAERERLPLAGYTRLGGYVASAWLLGIASNLVTTGRFFDIAVRDVAMSVAAFTLARLTEAGVGVESPQFARPYAPGKPLRAPSSAVQND